MPERALTPGVVGHEPDRPPAWPVVLGTVAMIATVALVALAARLSIDHTHPTMLRADEAPRTAARQDWGDGGRELLRRLRARERENLSTYQWLDDTRTRARIPIEHAMELLVRREGRP